MVETDPQQSEAGIPRAVRRGAAAALVVAFQQAQAAEATIRRMLARLAIPAEDARPVATLDDDGGPVVHLRLDADERDRLVREMRTAIRSHGTLPAGCG